MSRHDDLVKGDMTLKSEKELTLQGIIPGWWSRLQLESRFAKDKNQGLYTQSNLFDKLLLDINKLRNFINAFCN